MGKQKTIRVSQEYLDSYTNEIRTLKNQVETWKRIAETRATDLTNLYQRMGDAAKAHRDQLVRVSTTIVTEAKQAMSDLQHHHEIALVATERNTLGEAFKYMVDNLTVNLTVNK